MVFSVLFVAPKFAPRLAQLLGAMRHDEAHHENLAGGGGSDGRLGPPAMISR